MKKLIILTASAFLMTSAAYAAGSHSGGHDDVKKEEAHGHDAKKDDHHAEGGDDHHDELAVGVPGKRSEAAKIVVVKMTETDDGKMLFTPNSLDVQKGQTIHFVIKNMGEAEHEFVLDEHEANMKHKEVMAKFPEMEHDDPNSVRLEPGKSGKITWKFTNAGIFEFACLIPGHYESGMKGDLTVVEKAASN